MPEQDNWKEEFDKLPTFTKRIGIGALGVVEERYVLISKQFISNLLSSQAHTLKEEMKEALLDKFDEENDGITIMRGDVLSAIESIEI